MWLDQPIKGDLLAPHTLCLTFDDGPGPSTIEIAQFLAEEDVPATFFVVGKYVLERPGDIAELRRLGHTIGNHSFSHLHLTSSYLSIKEVIQDIELADSAIPTNTEAMLFRPPYGEWNPRLSHFMRIHDSHRDIRIGPIGWDIDGFDFAYWRDGKSPEACADEYFRRSRRLGKGIVLMHDHSADLSFLPVANKTLELCQLLLPRLRDQGYKFSNLQDAVRLPDGRGSIRSKRRSNF